MDRTKLFERLLRSIHNRVMARLERELEPFSQALEIFVTQLTDNLPADWRTRWHAFVRRAIRTRIYRRAAKRRNALEEWMRAQVQWPEQFDRTVPGKPCGSPNSGLTPLSSIRGLNPRQLTPATVKLLADGGQGPKPTFQDGVEIAGAGPDTTVSYQQKVQQALDILDPDVAWWWKWRGNGESKIAQCKELEHVFAFQPLPRGERQAATIFVDQSYPAGETATAIISEVRSGNFA